MKDLPSISYCPVCLSTYSEPTRLHCDADGARLRAIEQRGAAWLGRTIQDTYRILRYVDCGGMAEIYEAEHMLLGHHVAIKLMLAHLASDIHLVERFRREARLISLIRHPNVVALEHVGLLDDGMMFMVMELLHGQSLEAALHDGPLQPRVALDIGMQVCDGLQAAHDQAVVHRDIKPGNIYLEDTGDEGRVQAKVLDLGVAKLNLPDAHTNLSMVGNIFGTPEYMSPEQATGAEVDHRADIYSLGVVLFRALTGKVPFTGCSFMAVLTKHISEVPRWPVEAAIRNRVPVLAEQVILRALAKNPNHRHASMREFKAALLDVSQASGDRQRAGPTTMVYAPMVSRVEVDPVEAVVARSGFDEAVIARSGRDEGGSDATWRTYSKAIELASDVYWVGRRENVGQAFDRNSYLRVYRGKGAQISVLIDPGPPKDLACLTSKVESVIGSLKNIDIVFLNHPDSDVASNAATIQELNPRAHVWCSEETWRLAQLWGLREGSYSATDDLPGGRIRLATGHTVEFVPTPFCHFGGATMLYDHETRVLFSGDLFGSLSGPSVLVGGERSWPGIELFHRIYMPTRKALQLAVSAIRRLDPRPIMIAPQHGGVLVDDWMEEVLNRIERLDVGLDLLLPEKRRTDYLSAINEILTQMASLIGEPRVVEEMRAFAADGTFPNIFVFENDLRVKSVRVAPQAALSALIDQLMSTTSGEGRPLIERLVASTLRRHGITPRREENDEAYAAIEVIR